MITLTNLVDLYRNNYDTLLPMEKILIIGARGQIGSALQQTLLQHYRPDQVISTDLRGDEHASHPVFPLNATDGAAVAQFIRAHRITQVYHLAAILSATGEKNPLGAWDINMTSLFSVLEACRIEGVRKVFYPSSMAVFGPDAPKNLTPQHTPLNPTTVYGISKVAGEHWAAYYHARYGLDVRSIRYPGIISYETPPGGGTTDYAVEIFYQAVRGEVFTSFVSEATVLPMIYMPDAIRATLELMDAPVEQLSVRNSYNLAGFSFSVTELVNEVRKHHPQLEVCFAPDHRQDIANSWPQSIDDQVAQRDWGWKPKHSLATMTADMFQHLPVPITLS